MGLQSLTDLKNFFKTNFIPTQQQFWDMLDSFRHKNDKVAATDIDGLTTLLAAKASNEAFQSHTSAENAHAGLFGALRTWVEAQIEGVVVDSKNLGALTPLSTIPDTINVHGFAVEEGMYANCGGVFVPGTSYAFISRVGGVWKITVTNLDSKESFINSENNRKLLAGLDLFLFSGYINKFTGNLADDVNYKSTDFLSVESFTNLQAQGLTIGGAFRQATFFTGRTLASFLSAYTENDNSTIVLNSGNIPETAKYVRLSAAVAATPIVNIDNVETNKQLNTSVQDLTLDNENHRKLKAGVNLFTIVGYVNMNSGIPDDYSGAKHTDYLSLDLIEEIKVENLGIGGAFRQATFFTNKKPSGFISSYTADNAGTIVLTKKNIPATAKYVIFNTFSANVPKIKLGKLNYKAASPVNTLLGKASWKFIDPSSGYSISWGQYWTGSEFANGGVNYFNGQIYSVDAIAGIGAIHVKGWFYGTMPIVVFFEDQSMTEHVANGVKNGTNVAAYYDFYENVPAGVNYALIQQSRTGHQSPFCEMVEETTINEEKKKVILIGDSETQMSCYADELIGNIKEIDASYDLYNYGVGGERTIEIASRTGAFQMFLEPDNAFLTIDSQTGRKYFTIPAGTSTVNIGIDGISNSWNTTKLQLLRQDTPILDCLPNTVFINGIECLLSWTGSTYTLNRVVAGSSDYKVFYGTQITPKNSVIANQNDIAVINIGQNGGWTNTSDLVAQYKRVVESLGTKKYIIISTHYAQNGDSGAVDSVDNRSIQETALKKEFGAKFINMREYLCSTALYDALATTYWNNNSYPTDTVGETHPTATDTAYMANGLYAPMWWCNPNNSADTIHISRRTYAIYYKHIFRIMKSLKYFD